MEEDFEILKEYIENDNIVVKKALSNIADELERLQAKNHYLEHDNKLLRIVREENRNFIKNYISKQAAKNFVNKFFQFFIGLEIGILIGILIFFISPNRYDVNRDGKVTSTDYVLIKNYIMEE